MKKFVWVGIGILLGLLLTIVAWFASEARYAYNGVLIDPPARAENFELTDQSNRSFRLSEQKGKVVLIFFGYTNCPDVCPITLNEFKNIKGLLESKASEVEFVMVTVDPERDTADRLRLYLERIDPEFTGLTGNLTALESVWKSFGVFRERQEVEGSLGYLMDHTARIYVIDTNGDWRLNYPFGMDASQIVADLVHLLRES
jgi:protein SCO1/2